MSACNAGDLGSIPGLGRFPGGENGNFPVLLPGKFHGQRSLVGYSPRGCKELDTTERLHFLSFLGKMINHYRVPGYQGKEFFGTKKVTW